MSAILSQKLPLGYNGLERPLIAAAVGDETNIVNSSQGFCVTKSEKRRQQNLRYVLETREAPEKIARSKKTIMGIGTVVGLVLVMVPPLYFRELGYSKFVISFLAAIGGILVLWGEVNRSSTEQIEDLHDFIDFQGIKAEIDRPKS